MKDKDKTKEQLANKLEEMRQQFAVLEAENDEHKRAEEALRLSEEKYKAIFELSPDGIVTINRKGVLTSCNKAFSQLTGFPKEEFIGKHLTKLPTIRMKDAPKYLRLFTSMLRGKELAPLELRWIHKDGNERLGEFHFGLVKSGNKITGAQVIARDITERKLMEGELIQSQERFYKAFHSSPVALTIASLPEGHVVDVNDSCLRMLEYTRKDLIGYTAAELDLINPNERARMFQDISENGALQNMETIVRTKYGKSIQVLFFIETINLNGQDHAITTLLDITERKKAEEETRDLAKFPSENPNPVLRINKDGTILYVNDASSPLMDMWECKTGRAVPEQIRQLARDVNNSGLSRAIEVECQGRIFSLTFAPVANSYYVNVYGLDITDRKQAEEEKRSIEQKAYVASRLASIGQMASGIAHEINNPLTAVLGYSQSLLRKDVPEDIKRRLEIIRDGAERTADIVTRLLTFARGRKPGWEHVNINEIVETALIMRTYEMETSNIKVTTLFAPDLPRTMADAGQLQQVFLNLIINAETEMTLAHGRGQLVIKTEVVDGNIRISFKDDGPGIAKENLDRVFEPFFTTRKTGEGTGLGLSLCHGIIAEHKGRIYAESTRGEGATFIVELPIIRRRKRPKVSEWESKISKTPRAKILIVDDEPEIRQLLSEELTEYGHKAETAESVGEALYRIQKGKYDLIILDIKLRGMSGVELYQFMEKMPGSLMKRIIFITGDAMGPDTKKFLKKTKAPYIAKPFTMEQVARAINRLLAEL